jgi:hypothetical protein
MAQRKEIAMTKKQTKSKRIGFKKLRAKLARQPGVTNPGALAASIGRKKYGKAVMAQKSAVGRRKPR